MKKLFLMLIACCFGIAASAQLIYQPSTEASFTGGATTYCPGDAIAPLTFTYNICSAGSGPVTGASCVANWYYNPTPVTTISGATTLASGPIIFSAPTTPIGSLTYTPVLPVGGDYYFFCVITWTGGTPGCPGGVSGTLTSSIQHVRISPPPIVPVATSVNVCVGSQVGLSNPFGGGAWTSSNAAVATVSSSGSVTGMSAGGVNITYQIGSCFVTRFVYVNDTPGPITPVHPFLTCEGAVTAMGNSMTGGTWTSTIPTSATIGLTSGILTGGTAGTTRISYIMPTGCFVTRMVTVQPNPAPIGGSLAICHMGSTTLTNSSVTPPGSWFSSNAGIPVNASTGTVTGNTVGTSLISYKFTTTGCQSTAVVTVNAPAGPISGPNTVCAGSSITLTDPVSGGAWTSGNMAYATTTTSTGVVNGVSAGTVNISYTIPGCPAVWKNITVNPLPGTISGLLNICYGSSSTLMSSVSGGKWYSDLPSIATIDSVSGMVTGVTMGTTLITYKIPSGCFSTAMATVNPLAPIAGSDSVCVGSEILLTNIVGGGTWVSSNPAIAEIDTFMGTVTGLVTGITYIGYTLPTGCATTFFLNVIPPLPPIAGPLQVCSASSVVLSDGVPGGRWYTSNIYVAEMDSITGNMIGHFPDTATITYTKFGCITKAHVTVNPLPDVLISFNWANGRLSTPPIYAAYQWYDSVAGPIPGATSSFITLAPIQKTYYLRATDFNGCSNNSDYFRLPLAVADVNMAALCRIFPNPATSVITIDAPVNVKAIITSVDGRLMTEAVEAKEINISTLTPGMYLIGLYNDEGQLITMQKLMKE